MIAIDAQQELFTALKLELEDIGYDVYDGILPPEDTPYPFIYLGDFQQSDTMQKNAYTGTVQPVVHVWHNNPRQRGTVSSIMLDIKRTIIQLEHTDNYNWLVQSIDGQMFPDTTTKTPLLHGVIEATLKFS